MISFIKEIRNEIILWSYVSRIPAELADFLASLKPLPIRNLAVVIAFEQPWIIEILLRQFKKNVSELSLVIFDNSRSVGSRLEIQHICREHSFPYFPLPRNWVSHPNRSHGMAMTWIYHNFIAYISPRWFGFLDHDLIPIRTVRFGDRFSRYTCFGRRCAGNKDAWYLWAGYNFYRFSRVNSKKLNFLNDFSRGLDTGGRLWGSILEKMPSQDVFRCAEERIIATGPSIEDFSMLLIDSCWLHISGVGHRNNATRAALYKAIRRVFDSGGEELNEFLLKHESGLPLTPLSIARKERHIF